MTCYHPLKAFKIGTTANGKPLYKICSFKTECVFKDMGSDTWHEGYDIFSNNPRYIVVRDYLEIPCGNCIGCRLKYSRDWATRCMLEASLHDDNYFLTITYNDEHLPCNDFINADTGEMSIRHSVQKKDLQKFLKRVRRNYKFDNSIKYYACGEYGDNSARPHYHLCMFGLKLDDLRLYKQSKLGFSYYTSEFLNSCWTDTKNGSSKGFIVVADLSFETCAYTARYVMKKRKGLNKNYYEEIGLNPEFVLMSRRPGIAYGYYEENANKIYKTDEVIYSTKDGGKKAKPPRYFDKLFEIECPEIFENVKNNREEIAKMLKENKLKNTDLTYEELLKVEEDNMESRTKTLKRINI